jgi:hypothetical protein
MRADFGFETVKNRSTIDTFCILGTINEGHFDATYHGMANNILIFLDKIFSS